PRAMQARSASHPSADTLKAFSVGQLDEASAEAVRNHLGSCPECCRQGAALSGNPFLDRRQGATPAPDQWRGRRPRPPQPACATPAPDQWRAAGSGTLKPDWPVQATPVPPATLPPDLGGSTHYEIIRELGRGGMGVVYLAQNRLMDRPEVLKVVNKDVLDKPGA